MNYCEDRGIFYSVYCSVSSDRAELLGPNCPLQLTRVELIACKFSGLRQFIPGEQILGQRKTSHDFSPYILRLTCHHFLSLFSEIALTIFSFRYFTCPDTHVSVRIFETQARLEIGPTDPKLKVKKYVLLVATLSF